MEFVFKGVPGYFHRNPIHITMSPITIDVDIIGEQPKGITFLLKPKRLPRKLKKRLKKGAVMEYTPLALADNSNHH